MGAQELRYFSFMLSKQILKNIYFRLKTHRKFLIENQASQVTMRQKYWNRTNLERG